MSEGGRGDDTTAIKRSFTLQRAMTKNKLILANMSPPLESEYTGV